jgi:mRNA-degrading endonuclease RelE of RelBE toxin-antitoxin system
MAITPPMSVVEMPEFLDHAPAILTEAERTVLVAYLGANPEAGRLVPGTGGVRKIRWGSQGQGKRGGARVIYYYYNQSIPVFALDIYAKNHKTDLSEADKRSLKRLLPILVSRYLKRRA